MLLHSHVCIYVFKLQDPLAIIGLVAIFLPFVILGIGIAVGWVDLAGGR